MTVEDHLELYEEIKPVLFQRSKTMGELTSAQNFFVQAFEKACFEDTFLTCYAEMVSEAPDINTRDLHAFCLGYGLGISLGTQIRETSNTNH